jgi:hypothetical protein
MNRKPFSLGFFDDTRAFAVGHDRVHDQRNLAMAFTNTDQRMLRQRNQQLLSPDKLFYQPKLGLVVVSTFTI